MKIHSAGFTVIELMVTIAIVVLLTVLAVPGLGTLVTKIRMDSEINAVISALNFARSEAVKRGQTVSVCPGTTATCLTTSTPWSNGWVVSLPGTTAQLLQKTDAYTSTDTLTSVSTDTPPFPQFTPMGYTFFSGTLLLSDGNDTSSLRRCLVFQFGTWASVTGSTCPARP